MLEVYFETYGCTANQNSSEIMKGLVRQAGLSLTTNPEIADFIVLNSCIVKAPTSEKIRRRIFDFSKNGKKVIVAGCMPRLNAEKLQQKNVFLLDTSRVKDIVNLIRDIRDSKEVGNKYLELKKEVKVELPKILSEKYIGVTQISEGCLGECSYCIVRIAKGKLFSYPKDKILNSIQKDLDAGCKEIWITSQDNANYGNDEGKYLLPDLLGDILSLKGNFKVRLGMSNPNNVLRILDKLVELYKSPKMFKFLHLPIQSGSDRILKAMNRKYNRKDVLKIVSRFRKEIPEMVFATDVIVGYPGESFLDWKDTIRLVKEISPEILNRSNFGARPYTSAEKLKPISPAVMKRRSVELMKLHLEMCKKNQRSWEKWKGRILIDKKGFSNTYLGRADNYKLVAVQSEKNILGKFVEVEIVRVMPHYLMGRVI